ncbi:MAG TPA: hypothetical protein VGS27_03330 [Candidatus Sulfotelmatobacter sp.]|nr:hypothetical protein [Candidatus Sulfotelmatobacter sp.]
MKKKALLFCALLLTSASLFAQQKRLWVLRAPGEMVEYDAATFAVKQTVKVPAEALKSATSVDVNDAGQILFMPLISLPLSDEDISSPHKLWLWDGRAATTVDLGVEHKSEKTGSNQAVTEIAPTVALSADGTHLYWFANEPRRLQREDVDLSTITTWNAWRTDLTGANREEIASTKFPDCRCKTGTCDETCPSAAIWIPDEGVDRFFLMTQFIAGQTGTVYKSSTRYDEQGGKWTPTNLPDPVHHVLGGDLAGNGIIDAIPDTGCCGWANQSNDQTVLIAGDKKIILFDEQEKYKNSDYDVSFFTANAHLSPNAERVAMTITATSQANKPFQLSEQGQANPEESQRIRKALAELPAIVVKKIADPPKQVDFVPHASLVGWINDKEILIVEDHLLMLYNVENGVRRKSPIRVEDALHAFLR